MSSCVLVLENGNGLRRHMSDLLRSEGYEVMEAIDGGTAVTSVMQLDPGLIIMAGEMSLDGVELLPLLRRLTRSPIIVVGDDDETTIVRALLEGADVYLEKPVRYREMLCRVRSLVHLSDTARI